MLDIGTILISMATSSAAAGAVAFAFERRKVRWQWKRDVCLAALAVVDGVFANIQFTQDGTAVPSMLQQAPTIGEVRRCHNQLILSCKRRDVPRFYMECLGNGPDARTGESIDHLRDAIRAECRLGKALPRDRASSWIARVDGAEEIRGPVS